MSILVTGSTGFVGAALVKRLINNHAEICAVTRALLHDQTCAGVRYINLGNFTPDMDWTEVLQGIDVIIHLAARTHILMSSFQDSLAKYRYINVNCTINLARQASQASVRRFIYVSSIKVNGEFTNNGKAFTADDIPNPQDFYGISKYEAELGLQNIAEQCEMDIVIIRPPLIYGPGVKGNLLNMIRFINKSLPLPFGSIRNQRSLVSLDNLLDLLIICIHHPKAANQIFLVSDGEDLSTVDLCILLGISLGKPAKLIEVPVYLLNLFSTVFLCRGAFYKVSGSLQVDIFKTNNLLGWAPRVPIAESLDETIKNFLIKNSNLY